MQRNKNNYWNLYVKNSEFDFYRDSITQKGKNVYINKTLELEHNFILRNGSNTWRAFGSGGQSGFLKVATIKINSGYANQPISLNVSQRGRDMISTLNILFSNTSHNDPDVVSFLKVGKIQSFLHKVGTGVWDLYIEKSESYDHIDIFNVQSGFYNKDNNRVVIEWKDELITTVPSGCKHAKYNESGRNFNGRPVCINDDGVLEVGKYLDFHGGDTWTADYDGRISCDGEHFFFGKPLVPDKANTLNLGAASHPWHIGYINHLFANEIRNKGKTTVNSQNTYNGYWMEVAYAVITGQYQDAVGVFEFLDQGNGTNIPVYANIIFRVKQQAAMGQSPACGLYMIGNYSATDNNCFKAVVTENSSSRTVVRLYYKCTNTYSQMTTGLTRVCGSGGELKISENATPTQNLPGGSQISVNFLSSFSEIVRCRGLVPITNNAHDVGTSSNRVRTFYSVNALNTSDERYKENIEYVDTKRNDEAKGLHEFYKNDFKLATYNYVGQEHKEYGFIAQDFARSSIGENLVIDNEEGYMYSIGSYISSIAGALQYEIKLRDKQIEELMEKVSLLENSSNKE